MSQLTPYCHPWGDAVETQLVDALKAKIATLYDDAWANERAEALLPQMKQQYAVLLEPFQAETVRAALYALLTQMREQIAEGCCPVRGTDDRHTLEWAGDWITPQLTVTRRSCATLSIQIP